MNNMFIFFLLFGALCVATGMFVTKVHSLILAIIETKRRRKELPHLEKAHTHLLCQGPHTYDKAKLTMAPLPVDTYLVCKDCGFVSTADGKFKLNEPALQVFIANINRRDRQALLEAKLIIKRQEKLDTLMNKMVKEYLTTFDEHESQVQALRQFFRKSAIEFESLYLSLKADIDEAEKDG